jgi:hypothetical protein
MTQFLKKYNAQKDLQLTGLKVSLNNSLKIVLRAWPRGGVRVSTPMLSGV